MHPDKPTRAAGEPRILGAQPAAAPVSGAPADPAVPAGHQQPLGDVRPAGSAPGETVPAGTAGDAGTTGDAGTAGDTALAPQRGRVHGSRTGGVWVGVIIAALVLVLLLIFIVQNTGTVTIHFFGFAGGLPVSVALLFAAVCGVLLIAIPGTVRILQLRKAVAKARTGTERY